MKRLIFPVCFTIFLVLLYFYLTTPRSTPVYLSPTDQISTPEMPEEPAVEHEAMQHIRAINSQMSQLQSLSVGHINIRVKQRMSAKVSGTLYLEREKRFRMRVESIVGQEMDIGSNDTHFWFWSRRMEPPALYYARHEDLHKAMLKTPLNPAWMMESMTASGIDTKNAQIIKFKGYWAVLEGRVSANKEPVWKVTLIDPNQSLVIGHYLYSAAGKMIASSEVQEFQNINGFALPKRLLILWYEEGVRMEWELNDVRVNVPISSDKWEMPKMRHSINMGEG